MKGALIQVVWITSNDVRLKKAIRVDLIESVAEVPDSRDDDKITTLIRTKNHEYRVADSYDEVMGYIADAIDVHRMDEALRGPTPPVPDEDWSKPRDAEFRQALTDLINAYSKENGSDTPDHILAMFLDQSLRAFDQVTRLRTQWYDKGGGSS